jgi:hypothetical protein
MAIRTWHPGKLIILWAWGGVAVALALTLFFSRPVTDTPVEHLIEFTLVLFALLALSAVTWRWLGGKESAGK